MSSPQIQLHYPYEWEWCAAVRPTSWLYVKPVELHLLIPLWTSTSQVHCTLNWSADSECIFARCCTCLLRTALTLPGSPRWDPLLHCTHPALYCTVLYCTALTLHCTALHCTALHCTALHCTHPVLYCTALYCTALYTSSTTQCSMYTVHIQYTSSTSPALHWWAPAL